MIRLKTRFLVFSKMPPGVAEEVEALDRLAFANQDDDSTIHWAEPEWMALGFLNDRLASQVCLHKREILVGEEPVRVAGVGGVATHPAFLRRGFASQVLRGCDSSNESRHTLCHVVFK
jgi:predicted acetyltransferase